MKNRDSVISNLKSTSDILTSKTFGVPVSVFSLAPLVHEHLTCGHVGFMFCPVCLFEFYFYVFNQILDFFLLFFSVKHLE